MLNQVSKSFKNSNAPLFENLDLDIQCGEFCVLIGTNGSGKSTLLKLISGALTADSGHVILKDKVAEVNQDIRLGTVAHMTLLENIALSSTVSPKYKNYDRIRPYAMQQLLQLNTGVEKALDLPMSSLSGGQQQMIATLMAINSNRQILLLDEHTSALDPKMSDWLMQFSSEKIAELNKTAIMITHKMDDALQYGNRIIALHHGDIILDLKAHDKDKLSKQDLLSIFHHHTTNKALP